MSVEYKSRSPTAGFRRTSQRCWRTWFVFCVCFFVYLFFFLLTPIFWEELSHTVVAPCLLDALCLVQLLCKTVLCGSANYDFFVCANSVTLLAGTLLLTQSKTMTKLNIFFVCARSANCKQVPFCSRNQRLWLSLQRKNCDAENSNFFVCARSAALQAGTLLLTHSRTMTKPEVSFVCARSVTLQAGTLLLAQSKIITELAEKNRDAENYDFFVCARSATSQAGTLLLAHNRRLWLN